MATVGGRPGAGAPGGTGAPVGSSVPGGSGVPGVSARAGRGWRPRLLPLVAAVAGFAGLLVMLYPTAASWFSQYDQTRIVEDYSTEVSAGVEPPVDEQLKLAHAYNDALSSGALLEAGQRIPTGAGESADGSLNYDSMLSTGGSGLMGRLRIPAIDVDLPFYHGTSDEVLVKGIGHLEGTSLPVGGEARHSVLTGHRGLASATLFTNLDRVVVGDTFTIEVLDEVLTYKVVTTTVVDPDQTESLLPVEGKDLVTLVTCTPLGINSQRILVTGERVTPTPLADVEAAGKVPDIPGFPWWTVIGGVGTLLIGGYVVYSGLPGGRRTR